MKGACSRQCSPGWYADGAITKFFCCTRDKVWEKTVSVEHAFSVRQCSEDALVVWVGARLFSGAHGDTWAAAATLGILYVGVCISDMVQPIQQHKTFHQIQTWLIIPHDIYSLME